MSRTLLALLAHPDDEMAALGMDTSQFDRIEEGGARGWPDDQVTVMLGCTHV